jgi:hypothetical protein
MPSLNEVTIMTHTEIMSLLLAAGLFVYFVWRKISGSRHGKKIELPGSGQTPKKPGTGSNQSPRGCCG